MKSVYIFLFAVCACVGEPHKVFVDAEDLSFSNEGIFLMTCGREIPLGSLFFDYPQKRFYIMADNRVTLIWCTYCGNQTYWVEEKCCLSRGYDCIWECKRRK